MTKTKLLAAIRFLLVLAVLLPLPVGAHPHIFVDATATITFNDAGQVVSVRNAWTFDEGYSAWAIQGLDTDNDGQVTRAELQELAEDNMSGLAEYDYYTYAGEGDADIVFGYGSNPVMDYLDGRTTLAFEVAPSQPALIRETLEIAVNDPEYYVAITFAGPNAVRLVNAPANCSIRLDPPKTMPDDLAEQLYALPPDVTELPEGLAQALRGVQGAILVDCPGGSATGLPLAAGSPLPEAETALDAVNDLAASPVNTGGARLGGPPPEPGLTLPRTGVLGWVADQQAGFYEAMVASLDALKRDWTAFWVLGGLSFLYGVFHAAGPGHGKVVISSYVLANEAQVKRGVALSFASAMLQSLVAIAFVLVAASLLGLTSMAMNDAAHWIGIASYALIVLLGLWLVARKIFRIEHSHAHGTSDMRELARRHLDVPQPALAGFPLSTEADAQGRPPGHPHYGHSHADIDDHHHHDHDHHDHGHAHVVTPTQTGGNLREQIGVVLAVGLRPCSGALVVLAFALSQGLLAAGIVAVLLMGLGTALTTGALAALAVGAKDVARRLAGADNPVTVTILWWAELLAAAAIVAFGIVLLLASV